MSIFAANRKWNGICCLQMSKLQKDSIAYLSVYPCIVIKTKMILKIPKCMRLVIQIMVSFWSREGQNHPKCKGVPVDSLEPKYDLACLSSMGIRRSKFWTQLKAGY